MLTNTQEPLPPRRDASPLLEVHHIFPTIQGEGPFAGWPAIFIRLYGCNLQCTYCDTNYTSQNHAMLPEVILNQVKAYTFGRSANFQCDRLVVITGGEPFRQNLTPLCRLLVANGFEVQIETNGTLAPDDDFPWDDVTVVCSPKAVRMHPHIGYRADAFKYVIEAGQVDDRDGLPRNTLGQHNQRTVARVPNRAEVRKPDPVIYVQALDEQDPVRNAANLAAAAHSAMKFGYRLSVQTHKIANLE